MKVNQKVNQLKVLLGRRTRTPPFVQKWKEYNIAFSIARKYIDIFWIIPSETLQIFNGLRHSNVCCAVSCWVTLTAFACKEFRLLFSLSVSQSLSSSGFQNSKQCCRIKMTGNINIEKKEDRKPETVKLTRSLTKMKKRRILISTLLLTMRVK